MKMKKRESRDMSELEYTPRFEAWLKQDYPDIAERSNNTFRSAAKAMEAAWNAALAGRKD